MNSPYLAYSLSKSLRQTWLDEGRHQAQTLRLVLQALGEQVGCKYHPTLYRTIKTATCQAWLYETTAGWGGDHYRTRARLWAEVKGVTVVNLYFWDGDYATEADSIYIPGPWLDELFALANTAWAEIERAQCEKDAYDRRRIIDELGIGKIV